MKLSGKRPLGSTRSGPFFDRDDPELVQHVESGGNVGVSLLGPLVVVDVDHDRLRRLLDELLPSTFTVRTGSGGEHRYFRVPGWSSDRQLTVEGVDLGSIRSDGWQVVIPPSIHPETGDRYRVEIDRPIEAIEAADLQAVLDRLDLDRSSQHGGGGRVGGSGGGAVRSIPDDYPSRTMSWSAARSWLDTNGLLDRLDQTTSTDWSGDEFVLAKSLAEAGAAPESIRAVLDRLHHASKWHQRGERYRHRTVRKAIEAAVDDPYVSFKGTADMESHDSERRKMEEGGTNAPYDGGDNSP